MADPRRSPVAHRAAPGYRSHGPRTLALDLDGLTAEVARFLDDVPVAETTGAKLSRLLRAFLESEVLPQADRAADLGLDPAPLLAVVPTCCGSTPHPRGAGSTRGNHPARVKTPTSVSRTMLPGLAAPPGGRPGPRARPDLT